MHIYAYPCFFKNTLHAQYVDVSTQPISSCLSRGPRDCPRSKNKDLSGIFFGTIVPYRWAYESVVSCAESPLGRCRFRRKLRLNISCLICQSSFQGAYNGNLRKSLCIEHRRFLTCPAGLPLPCSDNTDPVPYHSLTHAHTKKHLTWIDEAMAILRDKDWGSDGEHTMN